MAMTRSGILVTVVLACSAACMVDRPITKRSQRATPQAQALGVGVTLEIDKLDDTGPAAKRGILPLQVTVANRGGSAVKVKTGDFSLASAAERYLALLPSELGPDGRGERLFPEGIIGSGESRSGYLYFRAPPPRARPIDLRVQLQAANDLTISETFLPLLPD
jgi:hypothetical protein